ncbi:MAG: c-type cytochrome [Planctomycetia bacterium]|nr:c-type cytochrome [Planctomycetia bacterium]
MPATEQTWRDSKLMHLIFGISSLAMLATTIWMLAADHRREWKDYQRKFRQVETWTAQARISQQESDQYHKELNQAEDALAKARLAVPDAELLKQFEQEIVADAERRNATPHDLDPLANAYSALIQANDESKPAARDKFREAMVTLIIDARFRENNLASEKKFRAADFDVSRSQYELGVGNELPKAQLEKLEAKVQEDADRVAKATALVQDATTHRKQLEAVFADMTADETLAKKQLDDQKDKLTQLKKALYEREDSFGKELLSMPILDAFGRPLKIDQIWLPKLTLNNNFRDVARFDRCTTCHQAMDKTAPGSAVVAGYRSQQTVEVKMQTPAEAPAVLQDKPSDAAALEQHYTKAIKEIYGLQFSHEGLFDPDEVRASVVTPESAAAKAQFEVGDVIESINGVKILDKGRAYNYLLETVQWGAALDLIVRRGMPNPFASHPRLDLFVGSLSPHKMADIGCTICHGGQGSATAFKWASHMPNDPLQADRWKRDHGWFDNHHWNFPMNPKRFAQSSCLQCHHEVAALAASERFPDPPAPKLTEAQHLIQHYGCFGCHEINGYDGPNRRVGPDLRAEPNYTAAAQALLAGGDLSNDQKSWAQELIERPTNDSARHSLYESLRNAEKLPGQPDVTKKLVTLLDDVETPGKLRRVGPSLRHVASKVDFAFLYSWIRQPSDFRPSTKMPQFFGLHDHLEGKGLEVSHRFEPVEIRGVAEYLLAKSQPFEFIDPPESVSVEPSAERGKQLFETRGCLACHQHGDFPAGKMDQGPDLSRIGAKLRAKSSPESTADGPKWLYSWLRNPSKYHPRTLMPNLILDPIAGADGTLTDPAADIEAYLLTSQQDWEPKDLPARQVNDGELSAIKDLALEHLKTVFPRKQAEAFLETGIPESRRSELKGDEVELLGDMSIDKQLQYIGRRTISKYGCSGCHDVPGFEDAKPIGTGLADWARKTADKLAFEQITEFMKLAHGAPGAHVPRTPKAASVTDETIEESESGGYGHGHFNFADLDPDTGYFMEKLINHQNVGFIWQKLREPRSYDYKKTENKSYNERLRMPKFTAFNDTQRETIITFVLGLVADPPAPQYAYRPSPRGEAIAQGLDVIEKFNCTGCHMFSMERWQLGYAPGDFADPSEVADFAFLQPHFTPQQVKASTEIDSRGLLHATVTGMPTVNENGEPKLVDEDGAPIDPEDKDTKAFYSFMLWDSVLINGQIRPAGVQNLLIPAARIEKRYPTFGGSFTRLAYHAVVAQEKEVNPNAKPEEAWGWLPPPLAGEGKKVQTSWLHDFLLDPHPIRSSVVLRMPKFNMSPAEASKLVNYFAAVDGVDYPYNFDPRTRESYLSSEEAHHKNRLSDALKIVTDNNYCIKCHLFGDFNPQGSQRAKAPQLDEVYKRLRPNWTLAWIAKPQRLLPYTGMPVNVQHDKPVSQSLYSGTSEEQLNAVVDLLLNYDRYMETETSIERIIKQQAQPAADKRPAAAQSPDAAQ